MSSNYTASGKSLSCIAPSGGVVSGTAYQVEAVFGIAASTVDSGEPFELELGGIWRLPLAGDAFAIGDAVYWDGAEVVAASTGLTQIGVAVQAVDGSEDTVEVRLNPSF